MANKKYLDYDGFKTYHNELVSHLRDLTFDPQRMFETTTELVTPANWHIEYGRLMGIKRGLIVTVGDKFWVETDKGNKYKIIKADEKADAHTDPSNKYTVATNCMMEWLVDIDKLNVNIKNS